MTNWKMYVQIQEHKRNGFNKSQTARLLGKDYKTVLKVLGKHRMGLLPKEKMRGHESRKPNLMKITCLSALESIL